MNELKELYAKKLGKAASVEQTIIDHLPHLIESATNETLKTGLSQHLAETKTQYERITNILAVHGERQVEDNVFTMMVEEAGKMIDSLSDRDVRDAAIAAAARGVEHYEIALYSTLIGWAGELEETDAAADLKATLAEEVTADKKLETVAEGGFFSTGVNARAAS